MRYVHPTPEHKIEAMGKLRRFNRHSGDSGGQIEKIDIVNWCNSRLDGAVRRFAKPL
jgi:hypothetical protein